VKQWKQPKVIQAAERGCPDVTDWDRIATGEIYKCRCCGAVRHISDLELA
jgi:hypothetical protein